MATHTISAEITRPHYARVQPPFVLVLDNYDEVPADAELHAALRDGIAALPRGFMIIALSRASPPPELARTRSWAAWAVLVR